MATNTKRDYYEVLGVGREAGEQEIKRAYRKLAMQHHPDRNQGSKDSEEKFKEATEAYSVLADPEKRARYDRFGHAGVGGAGGVGFDETIFADFSDIFGDLFGLSDLFGGGGRRRSRVQRGADVRADLTLDFEQAFFGASKQVKFRRSMACETCRGSGVEPGKSASPCTSCSGRGQVRYQQGFFAVSRTCPTCRGAGQVITDPCKKCHGEGRVMQESTITVNVPPGVEDGTRIRYSGQGESGAFGGPPGDLYVVLHVKEHPFFERQGKDLYCGVPLSIAQAALGAEIKIPTMDGEYTLRIPEGTQTGTNFRVRNKGVPSLNGHGRGDLFVEVKVQVPTKLTKRQRELLEQLHETLHLDNKPERRTLLSKVKEIFGA